jgi:hypothetical protein
MREMSIQSSVYEPKSSSKDVQNVGDDDSSGWWHFPTAVPLCMVLLDEFVIDESLFSAYFSCNLVACKGACCVEGDAGAPLTGAEAQLLKQEVSQLQPYLLPQGLAAIQEQGVAVEDEWSGRTTPLVRGRACAYAVFEDGTALCGIEKAWQAGATAFRKPISCQLYPIRVEYRNDRIYLRYHHWDICQPACVQGQGSQMPVFRFLKAGLIRAFGSRFYDELESIYTSWPG